MKKLLSLALVAGALLVTPSKVKAESGERVKAFVCPVIATENVLHSPKSGELSEGHYTIGGPDIMIPEHATNDDGAGLPGGDHLQPGEVGYTGVWAKQ